MSYFCSLCPVDKNSRLAVIGKRFRSGAKPWHLIVLTRTLTVVFIASFLDKSFEGIPFKTLAGYSVRDDNDDDTHKSVSPFGV